MNTPSEDADSLPGYLRVADERFDALTALALRQFPVDTVMVAQHEQGRACIRSCAGEFCPLPPVPAHPLHVSLAIRNGDGSELGELILLGRTAISLTDLQMTLLHDLAHLCGIAIERDRNNVVLQGEVDRLRESEQRMALAIANSGTGVWDRNVLTSEIHYSAGWKAILGYAEDELTPHIRDSLQRLHPDDLEYVQATMRAHFQQKTGHYEVEHRIRCKDGSYKWISSRGKVVDRDAQGEPLRMIGTTTDITERKRLESELKALAAIDFLTQLPNRRHFMHQLDGELAYLQRNPGHSTVVMMCDLDHFKNINDRWGHAVGDLALKHFAGILGEQLRKADLAGRIGGEEFAVLLRNADLDKAHHFGTRLQQTLAVEPLVHEGEVIGMTVSIGISDVRPIDDGPDAALSRSDQALYRAKQNGRNRIER